MATILTPYMAERPPILIPGLPDHLSEVPPAPDGPDDPRRDHKRAAFINWREAVTRHRVARHVELHDDPGLIPFERALCAGHPAYLSAMWLRVFEPRLRKTGSGYMPFIPFAGQVEAMNAIVGCLSEEGAEADVAWSKSRGWGASWIGCEVGLWGWLFSDMWETPLPWNVLFMSRKEEYVDSKKQRSLFWKIRRLMRDLPPWMMPAGFNPEHHDQKGVIINPANGNELAGESTNANAGRGDRVTWAWLDESAAMAEFGAIWSTIAETTDHRIACSTESVEQGPDFYNLWKGVGTGVRPFVLESDWWGNPLNDDAWFENQKLRYAADPDAFSREILRDAHAGTTTWVYPAAYDKQSEESVVPKPGRPSYITIDPGYDDATVLIPIQTDGGEILVLSSYANAKQPADFYAPLLNPSLFPDGWDHADSVEWTTSKGEPQTFLYGPEELDFARTVAAMGGLATFVGDTYGDNVTGATADSFYSRLARHGIYVNRDRRGERDVTAYIKEARTFAGRREALKERIGPLRFAMNRPAERALEALRQNRYKPVSDRPTVSGVRAPLHDWTSHYVTALEFFAVHMKHRNAVAGRTLMPAPKSILGGSIGQMGKQRLRNTRWAQ